MRERATFVRSNGPPAARRCGHGACNPEPNATHESNPGSRSHPHAGRLVGCAADASGPGTESSEAHVEASVDCPASDAPTVSALEQVAVQATGCSVAAPPAPAAQRSWRHSLVSRAVVASGAAHHRGRDAFYAAGDDQWVLAKIAYGLVDKDLKGEEVDIYVQRGCAGAWDKLRFDAPILTTAEGEHETVEGVADTGGRVYARIPAAQRLGIGHHRVRVVVAGDQTFAEQSIEVLPKGTPIFVSDVDGTLTERKADDRSVVCDEESDFPALWRGLRSGAMQQPSVHEGAPAAYQALAARGYRPLYLTARPEWLAPHTHDFLSEKARADHRGDLPGGIVHTTLGVTGAFNSAAEAFKKNELKMLVDKGFKPVFGFGNRPSDVATYDAFSVPFRFYFENLDTERRSCSKITDVPLAASGAIQKGGWRIQSYTSLVAPFGALARVCR